MKTRRTMTTAAGLLSATVLLWGVGIAPAAARGTDDLVPEVEAAEVDTDGDGIADGLETEPNDAPGVEGGNHSQRGRGPGR